ncbi:MAG TPA: hypothetical protein DCE42_25365 [Myxococcales bacterium]|nr:hypothetical protein [Deltaproteobacteria bacterium]MBU47646.1 hypothetical protein [Deltaproteobacteria bacterium]HAA58117.1 hypothetical protein [Myxococcales bacterium]|tara:strand:- start:4660 stop:5448 length:789 start_codon:yes stop_codon:yes gene_type:complete
MSKMTQQDCPSDWRLQRYQIGVLPPAEATHITEHLTCCVRCQREIANLQEELPPISWESSQVDTPTPDAFGWVETFALWWRPFAFAGSVAAGLCFFFLLGSWPVSEWTHPVNLQGRSKGGEAWSLYVKRHDSQLIERAHSGVRVSVDDTIRFHFDLDASLYVMVLSINEKGVISLYHPYPAQEAQRLTEGSHQLPKDKAIPLDHYVGQELFVMLAAKRAFSFAQARTQLKRSYQNHGKRLDAVEDLRGFLWQQRVWIRKVKR